MLTRWLLNYLKHTHFTRYVAPLILYVQPLTLRHVTSSVEAVNRLVPIAYISLFRSGPFRSIACGGIARDLFILHIGIGRHFLVVADRC
jgi:hypothetical protein